VSNNNSTWTSKLPQPTTEKEQPEFRIQIDESDNSGEDFVDDEDNRDPIRSDLFGGTHDLHVHMVSYDHGEYHEESNDGQIVGNNRSDSRKQQELDEEDSTERVWEPKSCSSCSNSN
jgi:hypothetical protein